MFTRKTLGIALVSISAAVAAPACIAGDSAPDEESVGEAISASCSLPSSCAEVRSCDSSAGNGPYTLYVGNDVTKPWKARCMNMGGTPKSYLPLERVASSENFSQYTAASWQGTTNVRSNYTKLRIDPSTLVVDTSDQNYATSTGSLNHDSSTTVTSMPFGVAMSCDSTASGLANVDLRGLPFAVAAGEFTAITPNLGGYLPSGSATYSNNNRTVSVTGGGGCGWNQPSPGTLWNPFNGSGGSVLGLVYQASCDDGLKNGDETGVDCGGSCPCQYLSDMTPSYENNVHQCLGIDSVYWNTGGTIVINGVNHPHGLGMHPPESTESASTSCAYYQSVSNSAGHAKAAWSLGGQYNTFKAKLAMSEPECSNPDSSTDGVVYRVYGDGTLIYTSDPVLNATTPIDVSISIAEVDSLVLDVDSRSNSHCDHAVWAGARVE